MEKSLKADVKQKEIKKTGGCILKMFARQEVKLLIKYVM